MTRYRSTRTDKHPGSRLVHNFPPGDPADPVRASSRPYGYNGFRYWITDEPNEQERPCYCGWLIGLERYGTVHVIDADGRHALVRPSALPLRRRQLTGATALGVAGASLPAEEPWAGPGQPPRHRAIPGEAFSRASRRSPTRSPRPGRRPQRPLCA